MFFKINIKIVFRIQVTYLLFFANFFFLLENVKQVMSNFGKFARKIFWISFWFSFINTLKDPFVCLKVNFGPKLAINFGKKY